MDDFKHATDLLAAAALTHREVADALGVDFQHYRQMRLPSGNRGHRPAPTDWQSRLKPLAAKLRQHSAAIDALADQLDPA